MGVDYNNCDHCNGIYADCGDYFTFSIEGVDKSYTCCGDCMNEVREMLKPKTLPNYHWLVKSEMGRFVLPSVDEFQKWCEENKDISEHPKTIFGMWQSDYFPELKQEIWIHDRAKGGVTSVEELKVGAQLRSREVAERKERKGWSDDFEIIPAHTEWFADVAWKNVHELKLDRWRFPSCSFYRKTASFTAKSLEDLKEQIKTFIGHYNLEHVPMYVESSNRSYAEYFVSPESDRTMSKKWCNSSYKSLISRWKSGELVDWGSIDSWLPCQEFVQSKIDILNGKIASLESKKRKLEETLPNCHKGNNAEESSAEESEEESSDEESSEEESEEVSSEEKKVENDEQDKDKNESNENDNEKHSNKRAKTE